MRATRGPRARFAGRGGRGVAARALAACALGACAAAAWSGALAAQVPFTAAGLGYPVPPLDARSAALGGTGIGLLGGTFSLRNPADIGQHGRSGLSISLAPEGVDVKTPDGEHATGRNRISTIHGILVMGEWAAGLGFGSVLDQDFRVQLEDTLFAELGTFPFEETRENDGGLSSVEVSLARQLGPLVLGAGVQRLTGGLRQAFNRRFLAEVGGTDLFLQPVNEESRISYGGWRVKAGAGIRVGERFLASGSAGWAGDLTARVDTAGREGLFEEAERHTFSMPATAEVGASVLLASRLLVSAAAGWAGWSAAEGELGEVTAEDARWAGGGIEVLGLRVLAFRVPLRAGFRVAELPFAPAGGSQPTERALTLGLGAVFRGGLADVSGALELGSRGSLEEAGAEESFRRVTVSLTLRGGG